MGTLRRLAIVLSALALLVTGLSVVSPLAQPAGAVACTRTWSHGDGTFTADVFAAGTSWTEGTSPGTADTACFPVSSVTFVSTAADLGAIEVSTSGDVRWSGGTLHLHSTSNVSGLTLADGATLTLDADAAVPDHRSMFIGGATVALGNDVTLTIDGDLVGGPGASFTGGLGGRVLNRGRVTLDGTGTPAAVTDANVAFDNDATVAIRTGAVQFLGGGTSSGAWQIDVGGSGTTGCEEALYGTSMVSVADTTFTGGSVSGFGCLELTGSDAVADAVSLSPGTIQLRHAHVTLTGDRQLPPVRLVATSQLDVVDGTADAVWGIQATDASPSRLGGNGVLRVFSDAGSFPGFMANATSTTITDSLDVVLDSSFETSGALHVFDHATLTNRGDLTLTPSLVEVAADGAFHNQGVLRLWGPTSFDGAIDNTGTFRLMGATLDMHTPFVQMTGGDLTAGRIEVANGGRWLRFPKLSTLSGSLRLEDTAFVADTAAGDTDALRDLGSIGPAGALELADGHLLDLRAGTPNGIVVAGRLAVDAGSIPGAGVGSRLMATALDLEPTARLAIEVGERTTGRVVAPTVDLAGSLEISPQQIDTPAQRGVTIIDGSTVQGSFASVTATDASPVSTRVVSGDVLVDYGTAHAPLVVTNTDDTGPGSLRAAVAAANAAPGRDVIEFAIPGAGAHVIAFSPTDPLDVTGPVVIDGRTQPGWDGQRPLVGLEGSPVKDLSAFKLFVAAAGSGIYGLSFTGFTGLPAVQVDADDSEVASSWFGVRPDGTVAGNGIGIFGTGDRVTLADNVIVATESGGVVWSNGVAVTIRSNRIGVTADGTVAGNAENGIRVVGSRSDGSYTVSGNTVLGSELRGLLATSGFGHQLQITDNVFGDPGHGNDSSGLGYATVEVTDFVGPITGNVITDNEFGWGVRLFGTRTRMVVRGNTITRNGNTALELDGTDPGDHLDVDTGPNGGQNAPDISSVTSSNGNVTVAGSLDSKATTSYVIDLYGNSECPFGFDEAEGLLASADVTTDGSGHAEWSLVVPEPPRLRELSAFATGPEGTSQGSDCERVAVTYRVTDATVAEAAGTVDVTVTASGPPDVGRTNLVVVEGVTATEGEDFLQPDVPFAEFAAGVTTATVTIPILDDDTLEVAETFRVVILPDNSNDTGGEGLVTIIDDDGTILVTNTDDSGPGSLRAAIARANARPGPDVIRFAIPGSGTHVIDLTTDTRSDLTVTDPVVIDARTQTGWTSDPVIELRGFESCPGFTLEAGAAGSLIYGLAMTGFASGIELKPGADDVTIESNWFGVHADGTAGLLGFDAIVGGSDRVTIKDNVIAGSRDVYFDHVFWYDGVDVVFDGNVIGALPDGTPAGNAREGLDLQGSAPASAAYVITNNVILGLPHEAINAYGPRPGTIVGTIRVEDNVLGAPGRGNGTAGAVQGGYATVLLSEFDGFVQGNDITHNATSDAVVVARSAAHVTIRHNHIHSNAGLGVNLSLGSNYGQFDQVTLNDPLDADAGPNGLQNFPVITTATITGGALNVEGTLDSTPSTTYTVDVYVNHACDASGFGEAERWHAEAPVTTDASGHGSFSLIAPDPGDLKTVTALATGPEGTSEPSACLTATNGEAPITFSAEDVTVDEAAATAVVTVTASATLPSARTLTVDVTEETASLGSDFTAPAAASVVIAAGSTTASVSVPIVADDRYDGDETFTVTFRPNADATGAAVARVRIVDDDPLPAVTLNANSPYSEDAGEVGVTLRLSRVAGADVPFRITTVDGTAEAPQDYVALDEVVTVPAGQSSVTFFVTIEDDHADLELLREFFSVQAVVTSVIGPVIVAATDIEIIDNDVARARFVRGETDPLNHVLRRRHTEGSSADTTLTLQVELTLPVTVPTTVGVIVGDAVGPTYATAGADFSVSPLQLVFQPGDTTKTLTVTVVGDRDLEADEDLDLQLVMEPRYTASLQSDDEAVITIVDDDAPQGAGHEGEDFADGWDNVLDHLLDWLGSFDLGIDAAPAVVTRELSRYFGLGDLDPTSDPHPVDPDDPRGFGLPRLDPGPTLGELCAALLDAGFALDWVAGGLCGRPAPSSAGDVIQAAIEVTLGDLAKAAGFTGDPFGDATSGVLLHLATALGLDGSGGWLGDLEVRLVVGLDATGFYVSGVSHLVLDVAGGIDLDGLGTIAGGSRPLSGHADADLMVTSDVPSGRHAVSAIQALLDLSVIGPAGVDLDVDVGPLDLGWSGHWDMDLAGVHLGLQQLKGTMTVPGLTDDDGPATLAVIGSFTDHWHLDITGDAGADYFLAGFAVASLGFGADLDELDVDGSGDLDLTVPLPAGPLDVGLTVSFDTVSFGVDGLLTFDDLDLGPVVAHAGSLHAHFTGALPTGPLLGSVDISADTAGILGDLGHGTGLTGQVDTEGHVSLGALTATVTIAGAIDVSLTGLDFALTGAPGTDLFSVGSATGTFRGFDSLSVSLTGFHLRLDRTFGASGLTVNTEDFVDTLGLGGVLPFAITEITVEFPDPAADLSSFSINVAGSFDFTRFPDLDGFTPRIGLGGQVVTPLTAPEDARFSFSVAVDDLQNGIVRPLDIGPLTLGFDGLGVGDYTFGGEITLGRFEEGEFVAEIGGGISVDGPADSLISGAEVTLHGQPPSGDPTVLDVSGTVTLSGNLPGGVVVLDLELEAGVRIELGDHLAITPRLAGLNVGSLSFPFGDFVTLVGRDVHVDFSPPPGGNFLEVGEGGLEMVFAEAFEVLDGWGGTARNIALGADFRPRLLPNFGFDVHIGDTEQFGLPAFIPLRIDDVGITFPDIVTDPPPSGTPLSPALLQGMRVRVSGGLEATDTWPISASVDGLEVDIGKLVDPNGGLPITNLDAIRFGVAPFELPGGVRIGGGLELGTVPVCSKTVFYGRIFGELAFADMGGGADLVVTQYGPVLMKVTAPLGIPLGPTGLLLSAVSGAAQFGGPPIPVPPPGDPVALLNNFTLPTDLDITREVIIDAVEGPACAEHPVYTWDDGFKLSIAGDVIAAEAPGLVKGTATLGISLGFADHPAIQFVGKGEISTLGIPLAQVGILLDVTNPLEPTLDMAFASPVPGSPLALLLPVDATFGVQVRTTGVILGAIEGLKVFVNEVATGALDVGQDFFQAVIDLLVQRLEDDLERPLTRYLLDFDGDGTLSPQEAGRPIDLAFLRDRVLGLHGVPSLFPANPTAAQARRAAQAVTAMLSELMLVAADALADPHHASFDLPEASAGFESLTGPAGRALAALADIIRDATTDALAALGERFDPSLVITGNLQPVILGVPMGEPAIGGTLQIDRTGLFFEFQESIVQVELITLGSNIGPLAVEALLAVGSFGVEDQVRLGARLPFAGIIDTLLGTSPLPTFNPLDPSWAVTASGELHISGFEVAEISAVAFLPGDTHFLDSRIQKLFNPDGTPITPQPAIDPDRIPITTKAHYESLLQWGGFLVSGALRVPRLVTAPQEVLDSLPPPPDAPLDYLGWLHDLHDLVTVVDTPARIQWFNPSILGIHSIDDVDDYVGARYVEGVYDGQVLGMDMGDATLNATPAGIDVTGNLPFAGLRGTASLRTGLFDGDTSLPAAGLDVSLSTAQLKQTLTQLGLPAAFTVPSTATGHLRAFTPGYDPESSDPLRRNGGLQVSATLEAPGFIDDTGFAIGLVPRSGGFDVHAEGHAAQVGPLAGISITGALVRIDIVNGAATVHIEGNANLFGTTGTASATLNPDLTGSITLTLNGDPRIGGVGLHGSASLTTSRSKGVLNSVFQIAGTATLPTWLSNAADVPSVSGAACVDTNGRAEIVLALPALDIGPGGLVRIGRNPNQQPLPTSPVGCLAANAPIQPSKGPLVDVRVVGGVPSVVLDGSLSFLASHAAIAGLSVRGSLDGTAGTGSLSVAFSSGTMNLGSFGVSGSATLALGAGPTLSMAVTGSLTVPGLVNSATVSGSGNQNGITHLAIGVSGFSLPVVHIDAATLGLDRDSSGTYALAATLQVDVPNVANNLAVDGAFSADGDGHLDLTAGSLGVRGAQITDGEFSLEKSGSTMRLRAAGRFAMFGASLEVVEASLTLGATTIDGNLVLRAPGGGATSIGGWTLGGTLRLAYAGTQVTIEIDDGSVTIPGSGTVTMSGSFAVPLVNGSSFTLDLPSGGLRMGPAPSPFFLSGTVRLAYSGSVGTLSTQNATMTWKDGNTMVAFMAVPSLSISTNGSVSASLTGYSATLANGFSFTVPSLSFALDPAGLNARVVLGAGSLHLPGLPALDTPGFTIKTTDFDLTLVDDELDLGAGVLRGHAVFSRHAGVFKLALSNNPSFEIVDLVTVTLPSFDIASNGTFSVDASVSPFGPDGFRLVGASLHLDKDGPNVTDIAVNMTGGQLLVSTLEPIDLPRLDYDDDARFDETFHISGWTLGPFLSMSSIDFRFRRLSTGVLRLTVQNSPTVTAFAGSSGLSVDSFTAESDGTFDGEITGRLALFGVKLASATFDVSLDDDKVELRLPSSRKAQLDLGFLKVNLSGYARSTGGFEFNGSASVSVGVTGFSLSGSEGVTVSSADGITGHFDGTACIGACVTVDGSLRSDGRIRGSFRFDANDDGDYHDIGDIAADWRVYLKTGAVRVDINDDGDYEDIGDIVIGDATSGDTTDPSMSTPPDITVHADIGSSGKVRVYYTNPTASDSGVSLTVRCTPVSGSQFGVGSTTVTCKATDRANNERQKSFIVRVIADGAAQVPVADNGATVVVEFDGFLAGSFVYVRFQSDPVFVGVFQADAQGVVHLELTVPDGLPQGFHDVIVEGFGPDGEVVQFVQPLYVTHDGQLPSTGWDPRPVMDATAAVFLLGFVLTVAARRGRRRTAIRRSAPGAAGSR